MTASGLTIDIGMSLAALAALCLSQDRHHTRAFGRPARGERRGALRWLGWGGIGLSLLLAGHREGWAFGPVQWLGALTGAGLALVLLVAYSPRLVCPAALLALMIAMSGVAYELAA